MTDISVRERRRANRSSDRDGARRQLLADRAYTELRDRIVTLQIPPGAPIDEDLLGAELKIGRTPVREAIKRLALENLVTVYPRRGTFASGINITDLADVSDVRAQLEGHAAYRAAQRITDAQRAELDQLLEELRHSRGSDDIETLMALDARVHRFTYRCESGTWSLTACRICSRACTSMRICCGRSRQGTPTAHARFWASTSRRSSARFGRCSSYERRASGVKTTV